MPRELQECENVVQHRLRVQNKLLVEDWKAAHGADTQALIVHVLHRRVPFLQATAEIVQIKSGDCYLRRRHNTVTRSSTAIDVGTAVCNFFNQGGEDTVSAERRNDG